MKVYKVEISFTPEHPEDLDVGELIESLANVFDWNGCRLIKSPSITRVQTFPKRGKVEKVDK